VTSNGWSVMSRQGWISRARGSAFDCGGQFGIPDAMHAAQDDRMFYSKEFGYPRSHRAPFFSRSHYRSPGAKSVLRRRQAICKQRPR
jgi:hypothetical protein